MKIIKFWQLIPILFVAVIAVGCHSVHNLDYAKNNELSKEGTVVFVRPTEYSLFGTKSMSDYIEIVYEQGQRNLAGLLEVRVGLRNRGGQHFWNTKGRDFPISAKVSFYNKPVSGKTDRNPPVYETNWQRVMLVLGETTDYKVTCPVEEGSYYQVTLSELK